MLSTAATLKIRTRIGDEIDFNIDLSKKTADIYEVYSFLIARILPAHDIFGEEDPQETKKKFQNSEPEQQGILDWLGDNAVTMDPQEVQAKFQNFLHPAEKVKLAFNSGRDFIVFTSKRLLFVDVIGIAIKKIQYMSLLYEHVRMFSVETAAGQIFDRDGDLKLYTNLPNMPVFKIDLNRKCDIKGIQNFLTDVVCGRGAGMESQGEANSASMGGGDAWKNVPEWLQGEGNAGQIDAAEADMMYHSAPNDILQENEKVEMAFKGKKDYVLLTTKRVLMVDNRALLGGLMGKKVEYITIPYFCIGMFSVCTAGMSMGWLGDLDAELLLYTDVPDYTDWTEGHAAEEPDEDGNGGCPMELPNPASPGMCLISIDLAKDKVDLVGIHRYLSEKLLNLPATRNPSNSQIASYNKIMRARPQTPIKPANYGESNAILGAIWGMFSDNADEISPSLVNQQFHENGMLQDDETVGLAFKNGRDLFMVTTKRVFIMDAQGFSGKKVEYCSIPFSCIRGFGVRTAASGVSGIFDSDCECSILLDDRRGAQLIYFITFSILLQDF